MCCTYYEGALITRAHEIPSGQAEQGGSGQSSSCRQSNEGTLSRELHHHSTAVRLPGFCQPVSQDATEHTAHRVAEGCCRREPRKI